MAYQPITNFRVKDTLGPDNPEKIIYGADMQDEFDEISKFSGEIEERVNDVAAKDTVTDVPNDGVLYGRKNKHWQRIYIEQPGVTEDAPADGKVYGRKDEAWTEVTSSGGGGSYDDTQIKADLATETQARTSGDDGLQAQIDSLDLSGDDYDDTQIKADLATETQDRIAGDAALDLRIDAVEDSISDGGGFVDAPNDGKLYGRESETWSEVVIPPAAWGDITSKPAEFPPSAHDHVIGNVTGLSDALDGKSDTGHKHAIADVTGLQDALANVNATSVKSAAFIETVKDVNYSGGNATLELNLANNFTMDFSGATSYTVGLSGVSSAAGDAYGCTLTLDTTSMAALVWDSKIKWSTGTAPTLTAGVTYVFTLITTDGGTTFKGFLGGEAFA